MQPQMALRNPTPVSDAPAHKFVAALVGVLTLPLLKFFDGLKVGG